MPSDDVMMGFMDRLGPELLFCAGVLAILAYVAVKSIPMVKELRLRKLENDAEVKKKQLEIEVMREERKAHEFERMDERSRDQIEIQTRQLALSEDSLRAQEAQAIQMEGLKAAIEESKHRSREMGDTISDTNSKVSEIHTIMMNGRSK